eukprot:CAMPEP_0171071530 /NCGR_PEP_ID=MMETSP0766_2-20121228/10375_1 /TAXON_ID=439317 /ORGANISM="Gambierdiscus australes, Strain CAWD 149" /LENGTH=52 /DNA_ID=CAMNT_0011528077 /DNA_START=256 /DNA_END=411 /DNA_ORIENTATION=-
MQPSPDVSKPSKHTGQGSEGSFDLGISGCCVETWESSPGASRVDDDGATSRA